MNISEVRGLFPHLNTGQIYFNHAAIGPWHSKILDRLNEYAEQRSGLMVENYPYLIERNKSAKEKLGKLLNALPERIAWYDNVSNGLSILANGIEWKEGDRIILNDIEFPSNIYPFLNLQSKGVKIDFAKAVNGIVDFESIEKLVTPQTKLISISAVQFLSGYYANLTLIGEMCSERGIIFCVDAIQAVGVVEIDVVKSKIDFLAGGTQKWLMSSQGLSYIFLTEEIQSRISQKNVGWASVTNAWNLLEYDLTLKSSAERFQPGTFNALGVCLFDSSLDLFMEIGAENIHKSILSNTDYFIEKLEMNDIKPLLANVSSCNRAGIVSFRHPKSQLIMDNLQERKIFGAIREGVIRFSPHFYNTKEEIDMVVEEIKLILYDCKK